MRHWQTIRWLLTTLTGAALIITACADITGTSAETTLSTPALLFDSPTPRAVAQEGADLVVIIITPTPSDSAEGTTDADAAQPATDPEATQQSTEMSDDELINTGEQVYTNQCATCHQPNGEGTDQYPALNNNSLVTSTDPAPVITTILHGRGQMPAFEDNLSTQQIAAVASYVRNAWDNNASVVTVAQARQVKNGGAASPEDSAEGAQGEEDAETATATVPAATDEEPTSETALSAATATPMDTATADDVSSPVAAASATATLATSAGVTWTPVPMATEVAETTPVPEATPEASPTTPSPEAEAATGTPSPEEGAASPQETASPTADAEATQAAVTATPISDEQLLSLGEEVYARECVTCHQQDGEGAPPYPPLNNNQLVTRSSPTAAIETVLHGSGAMPAFEDTLSNQEIAAVLSYVRNSWDNNASVVPVADVRQLGQDDSADDAETESADAQATVQATPSPTVTPADADPQTETTAEATPAPTETADEEPAPTGQAEAGIEERTEEGGVPKQAETVTEPPEMDSMTEMDEAAEEATPINVDALISLGGELYTLYCAACHQAEGEGIDGVYPNLANNAFVTTEDPAPAIEVVISGRAGMPRFGDDLSARQIAAILSFVRNGWGNDASAIAPDQVRSVREEITRD